MTAPGGSSGAYFFVSYAQVPIEGGPARSDPLVDRFFTDLVAEVGRYAGDPSRRIGLYDKTFAPGHDWGTEVSRALGEAEVLVALYSPRYATGSWTRREHSSFVQRIKAAHADPAKHIQAVRWMPLPPGMPEMTEGGADLGEDIPHYAELGLGALCDIASTDVGPDTRAADTVAEYREAYDRIMGRLARRIVAVAEQSPIGPSSASSPAEPRPATPEAADFVITVFAGTADEVPPGSDPAAYGSTMADWSPFALTRPIPIAQQARQVTERLDFDATVTAGTVPQPLWSGKPSILLIDAWQVADRRRAVALQGLLKRMPSWVLPLAITDEDDGPGAARAAQARADAVAMLSDAGADPAIAAADGLDQFMNLMPTLVIRARRSFFRAMPSNYRRRRRLGENDNGLGATEGDDR